MIAAFLVLGSADPALARKPVRSPLADYVRARVADADGDSATALAGYHAALKAAPDSPGLTGRVFRQGILRGDNQIALDTARRLDAQQRLPADGRFLLIVDALTRRDYSLATAQANKLEEEELFAFTAPIVRAWISFESKTGDPLAALSGPSVDPSFSSYYVEHRALLLLATGKMDEGIALCRELLTQFGDGRVLRVQLLSATALMREGRREEALALLAGEEAAIMAARRKALAGQPFMRPVATARQGMADLLLRLSADVNRERVTPMALTIARASLFADPGLTEARLFTSGLLSASEQPRLGLDLLAQIPADDIYRSAAANARLQLLVKAGEMDQALTSAQTLANAPDATEADWTRLGDLFTDLKRHQDAVNAYARAIAIVEARDGKDAVPWALFLLHGGALEQAGRWVEAKAALTEAVKRGPDQPVALNYLGYAQLERRENLAEAERLIERAASLRPDDPAITDSLGWTYFIRGQHEKAIATLERAVIAEPAEPTINEHLGDAYWKVGRRIEARYAWTAAMVYAEKEESERLRAKFDHGLTPENAAP